MFNNLFIATLITFLIVLSNAQGSSSGGSNNNLQIGQRSRLPMQHQQNSIIVQTDISEDVDQFRPSSDLHADDISEEFSRHHQHRHSPAAHPGTTSQTSGNSHPNVIVKESAQTDCPGCQQFRQHRHNAELSAEALRNLRLERIKLKILKKLRLKEPPNVSGGKALPDNFLATTNHQSQSHRHSSQSSTNSDTDDYYGKTEQVILFAEEGTGGGSSLCPLRRSIPSTCLTFKLPNEVAKEKADLRATSAELWVHVFEEDGSANRVFTIAEMSTSEVYHGPKATSLDPRHTVNSTDGWEAMNVSSTVGAWMNKTLHFRMERDYPALTLQIGCRNCTKVSAGTTSPIDILNAQHRPFLVINMAENIQKSRRRRNTNCHSSGATECCRESFKVSFSQIGWDWITHPKEFDAFYCRGRCGGMRAAHHHTSAMQAQLNVRNRTATAAEAGALIPCCTPKKLSGITIIVRLTNNTSETKDLPNMVVDSCGCAGDEEIS